MRPNTSSAKTSKNGHSSGPQSARRLSASRDRYPLLSPVHLHPCWPLIRQTYLSHGFGLDAGKVIADGKAGELHYAWVGAGVAFRRQGYVKFDLIRTRK